MDLSNLPVNEFIEKKVIGIMLSFQDKAIQCLGALNEDCFYANGFRNRLIFHAMMDLEKQGLKIDVVSTVTQLENLKEIDTIGGVPYLSECVELAYVNETDEGLNHYINVLKDTALLRNFLLTLNRIENRYLKEKIENINSFVAAAEREISDITRLRRVSGFKKAETIAEDLMADIKKKASGDQKTITGVTCGYKGIDKFTNGFNKGEVTILGARPSVGKTALALNMCYQTAKKTGLPVAIFSLEMTDISIMRRLFACVGRVDNAKIQNGFLNADERNRIREAKNVISNLNLYIDETSGETLENIIAKTKKLKNEVGELGLVMIDYLGLINLANQRSNMSDQEKVKEISQRLKGLAKELDCPLLVLSQLSRRVESNRADRRPQISDLRDSGAIEQDADVVMLIYRPGYYESQGIKVNNSGNKEEKAPATNIEVNGQNGDLTQILIAKNRNGQVGEANLLFFKQFSSFDTPSEEAEKQFSKLNNF